MSNEARPCFYMMAYPEKCCKNPAKWLGIPLGNVTDEWGWCDEHSPPPDRRIPLQDGQKDLSHD